MDELLKIINHANPITNMHINILKMRWDQDVFGKGVMNLNIAMHFFISYQFGYLPQSFGRTDTFAQDAY